MMGVVGARSLLAVAAGSQLESVKISSHPNGSERKWVLMMERIREQIFMGTEEHSLALTGKKPNLSPKPVSVEDTEEDFLLMPLSEQPEDSLKRTFAIGCVAFAILMLVLICLTGGCSGGGVPSVAPLMIEGQLVDVDMWREDSYWSSVLLEFEDGRVQKARLHYKNSVMFYLNAHNRISMDLSGKILSVEKIEGIHD